MFAQFITSRTFNFFLYLKSQFTEERKYHVFTCFFVSITIEKIDKKIITSLAI